MEQTLKYYSLDTHTMVLSEELTQEEKKEFGIEGDCRALFNEVGFATPVNSEAWNEDCFNIIISDSEDFVDIEVLLFPISKLPKRLEATYRDMIEKRG
jgi:hypothetical protein